MQACDAYISNPFLDAIGTGLVERLVMRHVIMNLIVSKSLEGDIGGDIKTTFLSGCEQTDTRSDLMGAPAEFVEHAYSIGLVDWFAQYLIVDNDDSVSCYNQFIVSNMSLICFSFSAGDIEGRFRHGKICRK